MNQQDIARILAECEQAMATAKVASMGQAKGDIVQSKVEINTALNAIDGLVTYYDSIVKQYQALRDGASDKKRALDRCFENLKSAYFLLRDEEQRNDI